MKICLVSGGHLPIPSKNWGGVEVVLTNYLYALKKLGHEVLITNTKDLDLVAKTVNDWQPDFVHLHYDAYSDFLDKIECNKKAITSHYPYIDKPAMAKVEGYDWIYKKLLRDDSYVFCLSEKNAEVFKQLGHQKERLKVWNYGIDESKFQFSKNCSKPDTTICLGKIESRKRQAFLQSSRCSIDFVGPVADKTFRENSSDYLGVWERSEVYNNLTNYANLVLLSSGESAPQVVYEALMAGLGVVVSEESTANLDTSLPFVDVVSNDIGRLELRKIIQKNRETSIEHRDEIREYGLSNFSLTSCAKNYVNMIESLDV